MKLQLGDYYYQIIYYGFRNSVYNYSKEYFSKTHKKNKLIKMTMITLENKREIKNLNGPFWITKNSEETKLIKPSKCVWSPKEIVKFIVFMEKYEEQLETRSPLQRWHTYRMMSRFIKTKNTNQCRSYHLRVKQQFRELQGMIKEYSGIIQDFEKLNLQIQEQFKKCVTEFDKLRQSKTSSRMVQANEDEDKFIQASTDKSYHPGENLQNISHPNNFGINNKKSYNLPQFYIRYFYPQLIKETRQPLHNIRNECLQSQCLI